MMQKIMGKPDSVASENIAKSAGTVSIAVFASRLLGLVREQVFAALFGAGYAYDAFVIAYRIPNLLRDLFAECALSAAFVTVLSDYRTTRSAQETRRLTNNLISALLVLVGGIVIAGICFSDTVVALITSSDYAAEPGKLPLTVLMTRIMLPFLLLVSLAAAAMGILNTAGKFFVPAFASCFFNLGSIVSGVALSLVFKTWGHPPIIGMACGVLIGGGLQLAVQVPLLLRHGLRYRWHLDFADPGLRRILRLMLPAVVGLSATQINIFVSTFFASGCAEGSLSWLQYAFRLLMFPIGLIGVSLSIATTPVVSRQAARGDLGALNRTYASSSIMCLVLAIPATFGLIFLAEPIVRVIFEHGRFSAVDTMRTAQALQVYAVGLFAYAGLKICVPFFYALDRPRFPVAGSFMTVACNIAIIWLAVGTYQHRAIAMGTSLSIIANFLFLNIALYRLGGGFALMPLVRAGVCIVPLAALMGWAAAGLNHQLAALLAQAPCGNLLALIASIIAGAGFYLLAINCLGIAEVTALRKKIIRRLRPR